MRSIVYIIIALLVFPLITLAADAFPRDLYWGLQNDSDVKRLQEYLRLEGFYSYPEITGHYFTATRSAVVKFQQTQNISPANGNFVGETRQALNRILGYGTTAASPSLTFLTLFFRDLYFGLRVDPDVMRLQEFLRHFGFFTYPESTGNYFSITQNAIVQYQVVKRLPQTGSVDALTRAYINLDIFNANTPEETDNSTQVSPVPETATSTFYKKIDISGFTGKSTNPLSERITIVNRTKNESIPVTSWEFETSMGTRFRIPSVYNLPGLPDATLGPLVLPPGGKITITAGRQDTYSAFRENICTGYFTQHTKFTPSIGNQCPQIDTYDLLALGDKCIATIDKVPRCTIPTASHFFGQTSECSSYMIQHLSYAGCVHDHRADTDFFENLWYVWLGRDTELFRNIHETLVLRDSAGLFVDKREY